MNLRTPAALVAALLLLPAAAGCVAAPEPISVVLRVDGEAAAQLDGRTLRFTDRMGSAQVAVLDLDLDADPSEKAQALRSGDVLYLADEATLVVLQSDLDPQALDAGYALIGHVGTGLGALAACAAECDVRVQAEASRHPG